jgi:hypothetical protein
MANKPDETLARVENASIEVLFHTVRINIECASEYEAQVLFDDLADRLSRGEDVCIKSDKP